MDIQEKCIIIVGQSRLAKRITEVLFRSGFSVESWDTCGRLSEMYVVQYYILYVDHLSTISTVSDNYKDIPSLSLVKNQLFSEIDFQLESDDVIYKCIDMIRSILGFADPNKVPHVYFLQGVCNAVIAYLDDK